MKKTILLTFSLFFLTYFYSCSSVTEISGTWKKPGTVSTAFTKIVVLGESGDQVKKSAIENAVVNNLRTYGINAVAGSNILTKSFFGFG